MTMTQEHGVILCQILCPTVVAVHLNFYSNRKKRCKSRHLKSSLVETIKWMVIAERGISTIDFRHNLIALLVLPLVKMRVLLICSKVFICSFVTEVA